jgi:YesN/AraC family two-component response regulator
LASNTHLKMPDMDGIALAEATKEMAPNVVVI